MTQKAKKQDARVLAELACKLWPDNTLEEMRSAFSDLLSQTNAALFLAYDGATAVGFAQCQLRQDYVEGTDTSPVGYLEGIYVEPEYRKQGIARKLLSACENWAKTKGCTEFASDCELTNTQSLEFHLNVGFTEANRIICFTKKL
uniref:Aminoglycoside N(6')-acetyltransferase type 1 n=1 Tax=uncultured bacterium DCM007Kan02 TaxID=1471955 RepID=X2KZG1_9BACT|nr:acetyltransferase GNAT family [uncultured bacterium DCM007Kan02]